MVAPAFRYAFTQGYQQWRCGGSSVATNHGLKLDRMEAGQGLVALGDSPVRRKKVQPPIIAVRRCWKQCGSASGNRMAVRKRRDKPSRSRGCKSPTVKV